jgi:hypothetical protein
MAAIQTVGAGHWQCRSPAQPVESPGSTFAMDDVFYGAMFRWWGGILIGPRSGPAFEPPKTSA